MGSRGLSARRQVRFTTRITSTVPATRSGDTVIVPADPNGVGREADGTEQNPTQAALTEARSIELGIRADPIESLHFVDDTGRVVFSATGGRDYVVVPPEAMIAARNMTLTHNHPRGSSFSLEDIQIAAGANVLQMRVVGNVNALGKAYTYTMTRPADGWRSVGLDKIQDSFRKNDGAVRAANWSKITAAPFAERNSMIKTAEANHYHQVWQRVSKELGLRYRREAK